MSSSEPCSIFNVWFLILEGRHMGAILNTWKQLDKLKRKHNKDTDQELCESGIGRGQRNNKGKVLGYILKMEMVSTKLTTSIFGNVLPLVTAILGFRHSFIYGLLAEGGCYLFPKNYFFLSFKLNHPKDLPRSPSAQPCPSAPRHIYVLSPPIEVGFFLESERVGRGRGERCCTSLRI